MAWLRHGRPPEEAAGAWKATIGAPYRVVPRGLAIISSTTIPVEVYAVARLHRGAGGIALAWLGVQLGIAATGIYVVFTGEGAIRPVVADAASVLPSGTLPPSSRVGLRAKLVLALGLTTAFAALAVGAFQGAGHGGPGRLLLALVLALVITLLFGLPIIISITDSVVRPIRELVRGTERVAADDFDVRVPVTAVDELGSLAVSFNEMVDRLRDHTEQLRESRARIVAAADAARRRVERDLHDGAQQQLVMLQLRLGLLERSANTDPEMTKQVAELRACLAQALAELRDLAHGIYPAVLENEGLPGALGEMAQRAVLPTQLSCDGTGRHPREVEAAVYFCCLEALQNAAKHAGDRDGSRSAS